MTLVTLSTIMKSAGQRIFRKYTNFCVILNQIYFLKEKIMYETTMLSVCICFVCPPFQLSK
jgi:hypothetical protein